MKEHVLMSLSGGMDSTTMLATLLHQGHKVTPVSFAYGSKHNAYENKAAAAVADHYGLELIHIDLSEALGDVLKSNLMKTGGDIPEGHYTDASMSKTVVPGRNIIFLAISAGVAWSVGATKIAIGIHQGDHAIYEDCRKEFYKAMDTAIYLGTGNRVDIMAPFIETDKIGICKVGLELGVPYHLTRTCYKDQPLSCGACGSCQERLEAFAKNHVEDPIYYDQLTLRPWVMV